MSTSHRLVAFSTGDDHLEKQTFANMRRLLILALAAVVATCAAGYSQGFQDYEQYLVPLLPNNVQGAFGSVWSGRLTIHNGNTFRSGAVNADCPSLVMSCLDQAFDLQPGETVVVTELWQDPDRSGAFLYVPNEAASAFHFELRVQDLSHQAESWGTEIPVVHSSRFLRHIELLDVPPDGSRFRTTLRIYALTTTASAARVRVFAPGAAEPLGDQVVNLAGPASIVSIVGPAYGQFRLPPATEGASLRVEVEPASPSDPAVWAFASVTNNTTQQVTTVTPQP